MACVTRIQILRGTTAQRIAFVPLPGELVLDLDELILYVGDGVTPGGIATTSGLKCRTDVINLTAGVEETIDFTGIYAEICAASLTDQFGEQICAKVVVSGLEVKVTSNVNLTNVQVGTWGR